MRKQILIGLSVSIFLVMGCSNQVSQPTLDTKVEKKRIVIDLDKEIKEDGLKGGTFETIRGSISLGNNDEVAFIGDELFIATPVSLYNNGNLQSSIKSAKGMFIIRTMELKKGDVITIKNRFGTTLVEKRVVN